MLGIIVALVFTAPSSATGTVKAECVVVGSAKVTDKINPGGLQLIGGGGSYTVASFAVSCAGTAKGQPIAEEIQMTSHGKFSNVVCGTGTAQSGVGQTSLTSAPPYSKLAPLIPGIEYKIPFTGMVGTIHINNTGPTPKDVPKVDLNHEDPTKPVGGHGTLYEAGVVRVTLPATDEKPLPGPGDPPPLGGCTKAFHVEGTVLIHE